MRNSGLRLIQPDNFKRQPVKNYPGGYICLIRDVGYGRYMLMRLRDPKQLDSQLRGDFDFDTDLAAAWYAKDAESAERKLRAGLSNGAAQGEWFDLDDERLREHVGHVPRRPAPARESATIRPSAAAWQPPTRTPRRRTRRITAVPLPPQASGERRLATIALALLLVVALLAPSFDGIARLRLPAIPRDAVPKSPRDAAAETARSLKQPTIYRRGVVNRSLLFRWTVVRGAKFYEYRWSINGGKYTKTQETRALQKSVADLSPGDEVKFAVRARNGAVKSRFATFTARVPAERQTGSSAQPQTSAARPAASSSEPVSASGSMIVLTTELRSAHVRDCPSTQCSVVGRLMNGALVQALETVQGEVVDGSSRWMRIDYQGRSRAFVHAPLLKALD